jgi:hypothetical protein
MSAARQTGGEPDETCRRRSGIGKQEAVGRGRDRRVAAPHAIERPPMTPLESVADVLDRELANARREGIVAAAAIAVAAAGALHVIGALQLWTITRSRT